MLKKSEKNRSNYHIFENNQIFICSFKRSFKSFSSSAKYLALPPLHFYHLNICYIPKKVYSLFQLFKNWFPENSTYSTSKNVCKRAIKFSSNQWNFQTIIFRSLDKHKKHLSPRSSHAYNQISRWKNFWLQKFFLLDL